MSEILLQTFAEKFQNDSDNPRQYTIRYGGDVVMVCLVEPRTWHHAATSYMAPSGEEWSYDFIEYKPPVERESVYPALKALAPVFSKLTSWGKKAALRYDPEHEHPLCIIVADGDLSPEDAGLVAAAMMYEQVTMLKEGKLVIVVPHEEEDDAPED